MPIDSVFVRIINVIYRKKKKCIYDIYCSANNRFSAGYRSRNTNADFYKWNTRIKMKFFRKKKETKMNMYLRYCGEIYISKMVIMRDSYNTWQDKEKVKIIFNSIDHNIWNYISLKTFECTIFPQECLFKKLPPLSRFPYIILASILI